MALDLRIKDVIEPGRIVNVYFISHPAIINAKVLSIPGIAGDCYRLKTEEGVTYVQMFEKMVLIR